VKTGIKDTHKLV